MHTKAKACCRVQKESERKTLGNGETEKNRLKKRPICTNTQKIQKVLAASDGGKVKDNMFSIYCAEQHKYFALV